MRILFLMIIAVLLCGNAPADVKMSDKAGSWYTDSAAELKGLISQYLDRANPPEIKGEILGIISPHAGYAYCGDVEAYGYKLLEGRGIKTAVIVGFNHYMAHPGMAVCDYDAFHTPLGDIPIDMQVSRALIAHDKKIYSMRGAFRDEQSTEMQIPFVQEALKGASVVIVSMGDQTMDNCVILADALYGALKDRRDYVIIASTDMCHFLAYDENNRMDEYTISMIGTLDPAKLYYASAAKEHGLMCGYGAVTAVMMACKKLGADEVVMLKHANSGDATFDRRRVVGYLSAAFIKSGADKNIAAPAGNREETGSSEKTTQAANGEGHMLNDDQRKKLLKLARDSITQFLKEKKRPELTDNDPSLNREMGAFVTLRSHEDLRGCIGNLVGHGPFYMTVRDMAIEAATDDPRFRSVTLREMDDIDIEISMLSPLEKISDPNIIEVGKHGVIVRQGFRTGVYLPQVATETGWNREQFMNSLCAQKAGIQADAWKKGACDMYIFTAEVFGEKDYR
ncbi:MAG: AmmeMemoRadiSam system protein B [Candidatus Omnitrophota bacterium]